jgi:hypothetical protein
MDMEGAWKFEISPKLYCEKLKNGNFGSPKCVKK